MSARRTVAAVVAAAAALVGLQAVPAHAATAGASVVVAPRDGGVLRTGKDLVVDVAVTNTGDTRLPAGRLAFSIEKAPVASTRTLSDSIDHPASELQGYLSLTRASTPALDPGSTSSVTARIAAKDVSSILKPVDGATPPNGARLLYAGYSAADVQEVGVSAVVRMAKRVPNRVGLGAVVPILAPANTTGLVDATEQAALTGPDGAWTAALEAARRDPGVTVALDPEVIASVRLAGDAAPEDATRFVDDLAALPNEFVRLAYADGDVALQRAAGLDAPIGPSTFAGSSIAESAVEQGATPTPAATPAAKDAPSVDALTSWNWSDQEVVWPVAGTASAADVAAFGRDGAVLLSSSDVVDSASRIAAGPAARVGSTRVLVADALVSRLLASAADRSTAGRAALAELTGLLATDAVTGESAAVLAVPGRSVDAAGLGEVLSLLSGQSWIDGRSLEELGDASTQATVRLGRSALPSTRVGTARALVAQERTVGELGSAIRQPDALVGPERLALIGALSAAWRKDDSAWTTQAGTVTKRFGDFVSKVRLSPGADSNAIGVDGTMSVGIVNDLARPVVVSIQASADNGRLQFDGDSGARVTVPAAAALPAKLRFRTVANGPARVTLQLRTPSGDPIGPTVERTVTVRAGFDTLVAVILLTALGALLALGVYRNVTRRRRPKPVTR